MVSFQHPEFSSIFGGFRQWPSFLAIRDQYKALKAPKMVDEKRQLAILIANPITECLVKVCVHVRLCITSYLKWIFTSTGNNFRMETKEMLKCFCSTFFETSYDNMRQLFCQSILELTIL